MRRHEFRNFRAHEQPTPENRFLLGTLYSRELLSPEGAYGPARDFWSPAALAAVKQWRYCVTRDFGADVEVDPAQSIHFELNP